MDTINIKYKVKKSPQETVDAVDALTTKAYKAIKTEEDEVQVLSKAVAELPILLNGLGYYLAEADANRDDAKDARDYAFDTAVLKYMKEQEVSKTEAEATIRTLEEYRFNQSKYLEAERIFKRLRKKWDAVVMSFDGFRSRLSVIKNDLREN